MSFERRRAFWEALVSLTLMFLLVGCLAAPEGAHQVGPISPPSELSKAYFILQPDELRGNNWPEMYSDYELFVCNPGLSAMDLDLIRAAVPGAICLAYTSVQDVPIFTHPGNPYYDALTAAFPEEYCIRDLETDEIVRIYGYGTPSAVPSWIVKGESIDAMVDFHRTVTMTTPWDGFYIDQCTKSYPNHRKITLQEITDSFDIDWDGVADTVEFLSQRYEYWRPKYTLAMRQAFPDKIMLANAGGRLDDPRLNGISLEGVGDRFTLDQARSYYNSQRAVATLPHLAAAWRTTEASGEGTRLIAQELGIYYGVVAAPGGQALRQPTLKRLTP